jgi:Protein of unknown function (DUF1573)
MKIKHIYGLGCGLALAFNAGIVPADDNFAQTFVSGQSQQSNWAEKMFEKLDHDFGVVARGADAKYRLVLTNKYAQPVHIASVRTSCGCTAAKPSKDTLASLETAYVEITMDTKKFTLQKDSSVTVVIDQPLYAEVRIPVKAYIRTDVVLTPGGAEFGAITRGADAERKIAVAYAGRDNWTIKDVVSKSPNVVAKAVETGRGSGRVNYELQVTVKGNAPAGDMRELITLVTDDAGNPNIPVLVEARIENEYTVSPELVSFGTVAPGERKTVNVVVRGKKPFMIEKIESDKTAGTFEVRLPQDARPIHVLPLTVIAPKEQGPLADEFTLTISGVEEPVTFKVACKVAGSPVTPSTAANKK